MKPSRALLVGLLLAGLAAATGALAQTVALQADQPASIGWRVVAGELRVEVTLAAPATVTVPCPLKPGLLQFAGLTAPVEVVWDPARRLLQLRLPAGTSRLAVRDLTPAAPPVTPRP